MHLDWPYTEETAHLWDRRGEKVAELRVLPRRVEDKVSDEHLRVRDWAAPFETGDISDGIGEPRVGDRVRRAHLAFLDGGEGGATFSRDGELVVSRSPRGIVALW